ncbi:MAG: hypothetical protein FWD31_05125 [Planctomycetaceae bacterium]|nr:hypothetical protein [Planctomycetaceae bacterium]
MSKTKTCCLLGIVVPLIVVLSATLLFYGFGSRIVDIYHVFEWNDRFGKTGEVLTVVMGITAMSVFWILAATILAGIPVRYATFFILPVMVSFPVAFALTPLGRQSIFSSFVVFSLWWLVAFLLTFFAVIACNKFRHRKAKQPRKSLDSLPASENVTRSYLREAKKRRATFEKFLEKCNKYGSWEVFKNSGEYHSKYEVFEETYMTSGMEAMIGSDINIAVAEYSLTKNVSKFRREVSASYRASWETQDHAISTFPTETIPNVAKEIFHSLASLDTQQADIQAAFLWEAIRRLRMPLHYTDEALYMAIIGAVQARKELLHQASERLRLSRTSWCRLFDQNPGCWLPYITGLATADVTLCNEGIRIYAEEHYDRISQDPNSPPYMSIQAVGMANLCRIYGINVSAIPPILPDELLFKPGDGPVDSMIDECFRAN